MPRKLRVEYPGAIHHVLNRGDWREPIFKDDQDREVFLATLGECCAKTDWQVDITRRNGRRAGRTRRRIVAEELGRLGWTEAELPERRKGDPRKVQLAARLREETTMTLKWIAARLHMGTWTHVSNVLSRQRRNCK